VIAFVDVNTLNSAFQPFPDASLVRPLDNVIQSTMSSVQP
jgi:hypothetical protein